MYVMNAGILGGASIDKAFPRGSTFFGEGVNPNIAFPNTNWRRIANGQVMVGVDENDTDYSKARKTGGTKKTALGVANLPIHNHPFTGAAVSTNSVSHSHRIKARSADNVKPGGVAAVGNGAAWAGVIDSVAGHTHTTSAGANGTISNTGSDSAHNNLQPFVVCEIWERTDGVAIPAGYTGSRLPGLDKLFPVGALLYAMADVQPNALYGGTWTRIKGRCVVFVDENDPDYARAQLTGGSKTIALTVGNLPGHTHAYTGTAIGTSSSGAHEHSFRQKLTYWQGGDSTGSSYWHESGNAFSTGTSTVSAAHAHTVTFTGTVSNTGGGVAHENRQPYLTCYMWYRSA